MDMQTETTNPLKSLEQFGQSPWLDFIERQFLAEGKLQEMIERDGLKGMTSNPSIFEKAMGHGHELRRRVQGAGGQGRCGRSDDLREPGDPGHPARGGPVAPVYERTKRVDGYVSLEVSPYLALRPRIPSSEARRLWKLVGRENLMVKVPGTDQGAPAIKTLISEGMNINVTLLFSQKAYKDVAEAFIAGLENFKSAGGDVSQVASVASFFVSRIDAQIDKQIDERREARRADAETLKRLRGKVAIANAKLAYQHYQDLYAASGGRSLPQQVRCRSGCSGPAQASRTRRIQTTSVRRRADRARHRQHHAPSHDGRFRDHGHGKEALTVGVDDAKEILGTAERVGLDLEKVTHDLVEDGVKQFAKAADDLLGAVAAKRSAMLGDTLVIGFVDLARSDGQSG